MSAGVPDDGRPDDGRQVDVEAAWAQIVLHWDDAAGDRLEVRREPVREDDPTDQAADVPPEDGSGATPPAPAPGPAVRPQDPARPEPEERRSQRPSARQDGWEDVSTRVGGQRAHDAGSWQDAVDRAADTEGFVPEEPPPLPRGDLVSWLAWSGVLGAPLFLLLAALFWRSAPSLVIGLAVAAFVGGFAVLVLRLPSHREDDPDDGAVI